MSKTGEIAEAAGRLFEAEAREALKASSKEQNMVSIDPKSYVSREIVYQTALLHQILDEVREIRESQVRCTRN